MRRATWIAVFGLAVLAGCGGGGPPSGVATLNGTRSSGAGHPTTTASQATVLQLYDKWAGCMRQHGVQMADPTIGDQGAISISASGVSQSTFQAASTACQSLHQAAQAANGGGQASQKPDPAKLVNFAKCMRAHGVADFPDPSSSGGIQISGGSGSDLSPDNPTFKKAQQVCQPILGSAKGGEQIQVSGPGGGSGGGAGVVTAGGKG
jgi:hypothetical protein